MWPDRRLTDLLEIEHPLVLAPMAGFGTVELAAAVAWARSVAGPCRHRLQRRRSQSCGR